ncbi:hypothetical protein LOTGIDRAFT_162889 [Lottia gigantea]|uniref:P2X purinoreceptor 7 intracellular domain-containing protein n=1 Tax=Lottia gigantea TaxID=225164 RepID=V4BT06_LOTGI|nr:hypothetical protein LOTGIDRAFT_162889 [Lottia gigantea]ESO92234.1 hypothetical protein LOTGIDRAFT_162889 [Lottia gigantea]
MAHRESDSSNSTDFERNVILSCSESSYDLEESDSERGRSPYNFAEGHDNLPYRCQRGTCSYINMEKPEDVFAALSLRGRRRYTAYRQFVRWIWDFLGKNIREPLPACVVTQVRQRYPSPEFTGFLDVESAS